MDKRSVVVAIAGAVVILGGGLYGASLYADSRASQLVDAYFTQDAVFETASHGTVAYSLIRDRLEIENIAIVPKPSPTLAIKAGRLVMTGIGRSALLSGDDQTALRLGAVTVEGVDVTNGAGPEYRADKIEIMAPWIDGTKLAAEAGTGYPAFIRRLDALTVPAAEVTNLHILRSDLAAEVEIDGVVITDLANGKIKSIAYKKIVEDVAIPANLRGPTPAASEPMPSSVHVEANEATIIDLDAAAFALMFAPVYGDRTDDTVLTTHAGSFAISTIKAAAGQVSLTLDRVAAKGLSASRLLVMPTFASPQDFLQQYDQIVKQVSFDEFEMTKLNWAMTLPEGRGEFGIGRIAFDGVKVSGFRSGQIDHGAVEDVTFNIGGNSAFTLASFGLDGLACRLVLPPSGASPADAALAFAKSRLFIGRLQFSDLAIHVPNGADVTLQGIEANLTGDVELTTGGALHLKQLGLDFSKLPIPPGPFSPAALGYSKLFFDLDAQSTYDPETKSLDMPHFILAAPQVGTLGLSARFDNVRDDRQSIDPQERMQTYMDVVLARAELRYDDDSLTGRILAALAKLQKSDVGTVRDGLLRQLDAVKEASAQKPGIEPIIDAVQGFLRDPHSLTFVIAPPKPLSFQQIKDIPATSPDIAVTFGLGAHL